MSKTEPKKCKSKKCKGNNVEPSVSGAKYCKECGCSVCFKHKWSEINWQKLNLKACEKNENCLTEKIKEQADRTKEQIFIKGKQLKKDEELRQKIKNISENFYKEIRETLDEVIASKHKFIERKYEVFKFHCDVSRPIERCPVLDDDEKRQWKNIYKNGADNVKQVPSLYLQEETFLSNLAKKYNDDDNIERERERESQFDYWRDKKGIRW